MCGEHGVRRADLATALGSPPHVRGTPQYPKRREPLDRITPACAGNTYFLNPCFERLQDHPRMCGEHDFCRR